MVARLDAQAGQMQEMAHLYMARKGRHLDCPGKTAVVD